MCECRDMRAIGIFLKKILRKNALIIEINEPTLGMYDLNILPNIDRKST